MTTPSTSTLRAAWGPACRGKGSLYIEAYRALDAVLKRFNYAPRRTDTGAYNCRRITGGTGYSLHAYGPGDPFTFWNGTRISTSLAVDINWTTNPYGRTLRTDMPGAMVRDIKAIRTRSGKQVWRWGGDYQTNKDAMHYEIVVTPADLATGIDPATLPGAKPTAPAVWMLRPGDDDRHLGGHRIAGVQMMLDALANRWGDATLHPGPVDGVYGARTEGAVRAFKRRIIALQHATHQAPWPNDDAIVGPATYSMLDFWTRVP